MTVLPFLPLLLADNATTSWQLDRELGADTMPIWAMFFLFIAALMYVGLIYYLDGRKAPTWVRVVLAGLRVLVLVQRVTTTDRSTVLVMVDDSLSMGHGDPLLREGSLAAYQKIIDPDTKLTVKSTLPGGKDTEVLMKDLKEEQLRQVPRIELVNAVLQAHQAADNFVAELRKNHDVLLYHFGDTVGPWNAAGEVAPADAAAAAKAQPVEGDQQYKFTAFAPMTRIAQALRLARNERKRVTGLAGVVLITDGQDTESVEAVRLESKAFEKLELPLPVHTVMVGSPEPPADAAIVRARGANKLNEGDNMIVSFYVKQINLPSSKFAPQKPMLELLGDDGRVLDAKEIDGYDTSDTSPVKVTFNLPTPEVVSAQGTDTHNYKARIRNDLRQWDNNPANNEKDFFFTVSKRKLRVLYIEGQNSPRWEWHYLKNGLRRDKTVMFDTLLGVCDDSSNPVDGHWWWDGSTDKTEPLTGFPRKDKNEKGVEVDELEDYDVLILGDISPEMFTKSEIERVVTFVKDHGGALIFLAGPYRMPYTWANSPLAELIPVNFKSQPDGGDEIWDQEWQFKPNQLGTLEHWTQLDENLAESNRLYDEMPGLYWYCRAVTKAKLIAKVLFNHPEVNGEDNKPLPIIATMPVGHGNTMFVGTDELWRLRKRFDNEYYFKIWFEGIRALVATRGRYNLSAPKETGVIGESFVIEGDIAKDLMPVMATNGELAVHLESADRTFEPRVLKLKLEKGTENKFRTTYIFPKEGRYTVKLNDENGNSAATLDINIENPSTEIERFEANKQLLSNVAEATQGTLVELSDIHTLAGENAQGEPFLPNRDHAYSTTKKTDPATIDWWLWALFLGLICVEWAVRKLYRMQ